MLSIAEVENALAEAVRDYLLAEPNERISEDENLRPVCRRLAQWLRHRLSTEDAWGAYRSVDDILPCTADRRLSTGLELRGLLVWMGDDTREWKEPLCASIHLSGNEPKLLGCEVSVGDADRGLGKCPYMTPHDYPYIPVHRWLFSFAASDPVE